MQDPRKSNTSVEFLCIIVKHAVSLIVRYSLFFIFNSVQDFSGRIFDDDNTFFTVFALCHLFGEWTDSNKIQPGLLSLGLE